MSIHVTEDSNRLLHARVVGNEIVASNFRISDDIMLKVSLELAMSWCVRFSDGADGLLITEAMNKFM